MQWVVMRISITLLLLACIIAMARVAGTAAARPIPAGPKAFTETMLQQQLVAFHQRVIVDAYTRVGTRNPAWDDGATRFLSDYAGYIDHLPKAPDAAALAAQGKALVDAGCDDPQVLYAYGTMLHQLERFAEAEAVLRRAVSGFEASAHPRIRARLAPRRLLEVCAATGGGKAEERARWQELAVRWTADALADGGIAPGDSRLALVELDKGWDDFYAAKYPAVAAALSPKADVYVAAMLKGRNALRLGTAATSLDAVKAQVAAARAAFTEAWKTHPTYPEAPAAMIPLAAAAPLKGETPRQWFDRAVAAQLDFPPAYRAYRETLRDRLPDLYAFGLECLRTRRFDTDVPLEFLTALRMIDRRSPSRAYWRTAKTYPAMKALCDGYAKTGRGGDANWYRTLLAAAAWYSRRYPEARTLLDALGDNVQPTVFSRVFNARYDLAAPEVYAMSGTSAAKIELARALESRKRPEALKIYAALLGKLTDEREKRYVRQRLGELQIAEKLQNGTWIDITPDAGLSGWTVRGGSWGVTKNGLLKGASGRDGLLLVCDRDYGQRVEVRGEIIFLRSQYTNFNAAVLLGVSDTDFISVAAYARENRAVLRRRFDDAGAAALTAPVKDANTFLIAANGSTVTVTLNGMQIVRDTAVPGDGELGGRIGVGGNYWYPGVEVAFRRLQVRRVPPPPPAGRGATSPPQKGAANGASTDAAPAHRPPR